jgi:predicted phage terminase large subunit-like protein
LLSRIRSAAGIPGTVASATNPGGEGHEWVLERWAPWLMASDPDYKGVRANPGEFAWYISHGDERRWVTPEEAAETNAAWLAADPITRTTMPRALTSVFVPARLIDNPHLLDNDPEYAARLNDLDRHTYEQLMNGNWLSKPARGDYFQRSMIEIIDAPPKGHITWVRWWDRAATVPDPKKGNDPDWTVGALVGRTEQGDAVIGDIVRMRGKPGDVESTILKTSRDVDGRKRAIRLARDPGSAGVFEADYYVQALAGYDVEAVPETGDKETRARPLSAYAKAGRVKMLRAPWNRVCLDEMESFPFGKKDQVDALANAFSQLFSDDILARSRMKRAMAAARAGG